MTGRYLSVRATRASTEPYSLGHTAGIPNAEQLVWDAEQALRALQGHHVDSGDLWTLRRLLNTLETMQ